MHAKSQYFPAQTPPSTSRLQSPYRCLQVLRGDTLSRRIIPILSSRRREIPSIWVRWRLGWEPCRRMSRQRGERGRCGTIRCLDALLRIPLAQLARIDASLGRYMSCLSRQEQGKSAGTRRWDRAAVSIRFVVVVGVSVSQKFQTQYLRFRFRLGLASPRATHARPGSF